MGQLVDQVMTGFQLFINFATICTLLYTLTKFMAKPADSMRERLEALEDWKLNIDRRLTLGNEHFASIDEANAVSQQALLAILDASIGGENKEELKKARTELYEYITNKRHSR